ncbi:hypothetical protein [Marinoscillum sp.]|uniref:hypothetical protein n=1 Tax=Marinoscillum sp. TaxID=2024838 RepID=UPI003BAB5B6D
MTIETLSIGRLSILIIILLGCSKPPEKYFEGILTYKIYNKTEGYPDDQPFGTELKVFLKEGQLKRVYNTTQQGGIREELYNSELGVVFMKIVGSDTILRADVTRNPYHSLINMETRSTQKTFLNQECRVLEMNTIHKNGDLEFPWDLEFYYSDTLRVNPNLFEDWRFGFYNKGIKEMGAYYLKLIEKSPATYTEYEIIDIQPQALNDSLFEVDSSKVITDFQW